MPYGSASAVKEILLLTVSTWDTEVGDCLVSAEALVDGFLKARGLLVAVVAPQNVKDASNYFAAYLFRKRRDPEGAEAFWAEATRFLDAYIEAEYVPYVGVA